MSTEPIIGGMHICRPEPIACQIGDEIGFTLMSDLHIGAANADYKKIGREIQDAADNGDRVLLNGDVLDMILPKDSRRYKPSSIHPRLAGRDDLVNAAVEWAVEILSPVATQIDMIGIGNHEEKTTHWHGVDPTLLVIYELERLCKDKGMRRTINYGGYTGFVDYRFRSRSSKGGSRWVIYYHHGSGGTSPVTKGMIDFNRKDTWIDADAIWLGHKHNRWAGHVEKIRCPREGDDPTINDVRHIMTGAYFKTYAGQSQQSVRGHGRRSNYAADAGLSPQGMGGARVLAKLLRDHRMDVKVIQ